MGKKHFCSFQTAETGDQTPNSSVKGSGANHYPRAPAQCMIALWNHCRLWTLFHYFFPLLYDCTVKSLWGQFLFINSKFHSNSFLSIPESIPIPLVLKKTIQIPKKSIPYQFHPRMRLLIHIEQLYNNLI